MDGSELMIVPISSGIYNLTVEVNDSDHHINLTVFVNITSNSPPLIYENAITLANWTVNNVHSIRMNTFFYDPDGDSLTYNTSQPHNISVSLSAKSAFFVPDVDWSGSRLITLKASDGQYQVERVITLRVQSSTPPSSSSTQPSVQSVVIPLSLPTLSWKEDSQGSIDVAQFTQLLDPKISVSGLSSIDAKVEGSLITFIPQKDFYGVENGVVSVVDGNSTFEGPIKLNVVNENDPIALSKLPSITLDENNSQVEINLADYFQDPDGGELSFDVETGNGVNVSFKSKSVVILSLAGGEGNTSARIIARSSSGKQVSSDMLITLVDAIQSDRDWGNLFAQVIIAVLLLSILGLGVSRFKSSTVRSSRIGHIHNTIDEVYKDPEMRRTLKIQATKHKDVITPSEQILKLLDRSYVGLKKAYADYFIARKSMHSEPPAYRREVLYIKETISSLRAIISSTDDRLISSALAAEKSKLMRAYHSIQGKADLSRDDLRKLLLYTMEAASALHEVSAVSDDMLITYEIKKQARRMRKVTDSLSFKLEDTYRR